MTLKAIHQFVSTLSPYDAVSNSLLLTQKLLLKLGYQSEIYVEHINGEVSADQNHHDQLKQNKDEALLMHHCMGLKPEIEHWFSGLTNPKSIIYHNITPPKFFKKDDINFKNSELGRKQLEQFRPQLQGIISVSDYNAAELKTMGYEKIAIIPLLFTLEELQNQSMDDIVTPNKAENGYLLLHVGRLVRNKCIDQIIDSYFQLLHLLKQPSNLVLIGKGSDKAYRKELFAKCKKLGIFKQVRFLGSVSEAIKKAFLSHANAYLCLSDHEGFCVPLIEAAANGVPVVAYDSSNIKNTMNNSGIILQDKSPENVAAHLSVLNKDAELRQNIISGQYAALGKFKEEQLLSQLQAFIRQNLINGEDKS